MNLLYQKVKRRTKEKKRKERFEQAKKQLKNKMRIFAVNEYHMEIIYINNGNNGAENRGEGRLN